MMQLWGQLMYDAVGAQECSIVWNARVEPFV